MQYRIKPKLLSLLPNTTERQCFMHALYTHCVSSSYIVCISGLFVGIVLTLQGVYLLEKFSAQNQVGHMVIASILRELGPVITALLFIGNIGSSSTAEIGIMRLTEQESALISLGISPARYLYIPKFAAGIVALPLLLILFLTFATLGAMHVAASLGIDSGIFWISVRSNIFASDVHSGFIKIIIFSIMIQCSSLIYGKTSKRSSQGIALATTHCVVFASVMVFALDAVLTVYFLKEIWQ